MFLVETRMMSVKVEDLGLTVRRGQPVWITAEQKTSSVCLQKLQQLGHVRVVFKQPSRAEKPAPVATRRAHLARPPAPTKQPKKVEKEPPALSRQEVDQIASRAAQKALRGVPVHPPTPTLAELGQSVERAVERAVGQALGGREAAPPLAHEPKKREAKGIEEPQFIPEGIVKPDEDTPVLETGKKSSSDPGVADAAKALRKARGTKKEEKAK
jgi:hypothetical protein